MGFGSRVCANQSEGDDHVASDSSLRMPATTRRCVSGGDLIDRPQTIHRVDLFSGVPVRNEGANLRRSDVRPLIPRRTFYRVLAHGGVEALCRESP